MLKRIYILGGVYKNYNFQNLLNRGIDFGQRGDIGGYHAGK
jgi:hypothetical protein